MKIYNRKLSTEILILDDVGHVRITPQYYDSENPHFKIELDCIDFFTHAKQCNDCGAFLNAFGTDTFDWYLEYKETSYRLNLKDFGGIDIKNNQLVRQSGYYFSGTLMKLNIDTDTEESLEEYLNDLIILEEYEKCVYVRDKLNVIKNHSND